MEITNLLWSDIKIEHFTKTKLIDKMVLAHVFIEKDSVSLTEYDEKHYATGRHCLYRSPKVVKLTPFGFEIDAEWWGTQFKQLKNGKTKLINLSSHKVKIIAEF